VNHIGIDDPETGIYRTIPLPDALDDAVYAAYALLNSFHIPGLYVDEDCIKQFVVLYNLDGVAHATTVEAWDKQEAHEVLARAAMCGVITIPPS
jgi:hypothetical protein